MSIVYENELIKIEVEESEIPWLKVFTQKAYKEFSETPSEVKLEIWAALQKNGVSVPIPIRKIITYPNAI